MYYLVSYLYMAFFSINIPAPADPLHLQTLGYLQFNYDMIDVYWRRSERQVLFKRGVSWFIQPGDNIRKSIATLAECMERDLITVRLSIYERGRFEPADRIMKEGFLNCEWSDFASDFMIMSACVQHRSIAPGPENIELAIPELNDLLKTPPHIRRLPFYG